MAFLQSSITSNREVVLPESRQVALVAHYRAQQGVMGVETAVEILDPADQKLLAQLGRQGKLDNRRVRVLGEAHDTRVARQHMPLLQKGLHCRIGMEGRAFSDYLPRKFITNLTSKE